MYWLLDEEVQKRVRGTVRNLITGLSVITGNPQNDQLFPYVGRKDRRKAEIIIRHLSAEGEVVCDPFSGSAIIPYATEALNRKLVANEWEPYANRISSAPWRLPDKVELEAAYNALVDEIKPELDELYQIICSCGNKHVLDSQFFDRVPLRYKGVEKHERLGENGETITYRRKYKCPHCGRKEKHFDKTDEEHLAELEKREIIDPVYSFELIENSRINLTKEFTTYGNLFPHRSKLVLVIIWNALQRLDCDVTIKMFLEDVFLSIMPQAKYKDYRSKSQDLHCPQVMLREKNLLYAYQTQFGKRWTGLSQYSFAREATNPIAMHDYREFLGLQDSGSIGLILTDPPWTDGTAYFERAQLYHPWLNYDLKLDQERLDKEMVVTDAPSRKDEHDIERWWEDLEELFEKSYLKLKPNRYLALFFRPIPAASWLANLNRIKLIARKTGFEPLLSIDVGSSDPSMRIQQSASYVFSKDVVMLFLRLEPTIQRHFVGDYDLDHLVYQTAVELQEELHEPFFYRTWRSAFSTKLQEKNLSQVDSPQEEDRVYALFMRYCDPISSGRYLPKMRTPFSDQLFDTPAVERLFTYVPHIIEELTREGETFTYDQFLLALAEFLENGTRQLISNIQKVDIRKLILTYADLVDGGLRFRRRALPKLPQGLKNILELDPYEFEIFIARLLEAQGYTSVSVAGRSGDRGVDVIGIDPQGRRTVAQCKRYITNNVDATPIQRLHSFAVTRGAERKIAFTTTGFTRQAKHEASITDTELVNGDKLETIVAKYLPDYFEK